MIETKLSVKEIERIIVSYLGGVRTNLIVPNLSWGFLNHEADLISIDKNGYLTEVEIKRSFEDFKADFKKENYHDTDERVYRFGYFVPKSILIECIEYNSEHYEVVEYADKTWVTELCFPVKPTRYFVLDFLTEGK